MKIPSALLVARVAAVGTIAAYVLGALPQRYGFFVAIAVAVFFITAGVSLVRASKQFDLTGLKRIPGISRYLKDYRQGGNSE